MKISKIVIALTVMALFVLTACGGANSGSTSGTAKNELVVAQNADAISLDPHKSNDSASAVPMDQIYDRLVALDKDMKVKPELAESWKQINDTTWQFNLRHGVKFHNGEELKASDVKFTFDRLLDPKTAAPGAFVLDPVKEVKVIDDYTVQIITKKPFAPILYNLSHTATSILNQKAVEAAGNSYGEHPVGTGPFKFVKWDKDSRIVLEKYKEYFEGAPKLDKVTFRIIPESATSVAELRTGGVNMVLSLPAQYISQLQSNKNVTISKVPSFAVKYIGMNENVKPFNDPRVRQAINYAIDKKAVIKAAYKNTAVPQKGPLAPGINGYNDKLKGYEYNPEKAKQLLKEAGYAKGFKTTLYLSDKDEDGKIATVVQSELEKVGIQVDQQVLEWGAYLDKTAQGVPMFILSWSTVTGDADNGLYANFHSKNVGAPGNRAFYKNPEVDQLLDQAQAESDPAKRQAEYEKAQEIIEKDAPWAFLAVSQGIVGLNKNVKGFVNMPTQNYYFKSISIK
ncbi:MAG: glutathione ABC transporter substrate-binding protein [Tuberibacillus sp.]